MAASGGPLVQVCESLLGITEKHEWGEHVPKGVGPLSIVPDRADTMEECLCDMDPRCCCVVH